MKRETAAPPALPALPCACANLRRAARAVTQMYDEGLRDAGLRATQFTLLQVLARRGEMTQGELGEILAADSTTLSRTLQPLTGEKWIQSRRGADRREVHWSITPAGRRKVESATPAWEAMQSRLRRRLGAERWNVLMADLPVAAAAAGLG